MLIFTTFDPGSLSSKWANLSLSFHWYPSSWISSIKRSTGAILACAPFLVIRPERIVPTNSTGKWSPDLEVGSSWLQRSTRQLEFRRELSRKSLVRPYWVSSKEYRAPRLGQLFKSFRLGPPRKGTGGELGAWKPARYRKRYEVWKRKGLARRYAGKGCWLPFALVRGQ